MQTPYIIQTINPNGDGPTTATMTIVLDRRNPERVLCRCPDVNIAVKIATALNAQFRAGRDRRQLLKKG